jgi:hypothetical protein
MSIDEPAVGGLPLLRPPPFGFLVVDLDAAFSTGRRVSSSDEKPLCKPQKSPRQSEHWNTHPVHAKALLMRESPDRRAARIRSHATALLNRGQGLVPNPLQVRHLLQLAVDLLVPLDRRLLRA